MGRAILSPVLANPSPGYISSAISQQALNPSSVMTCSDSVEAINYTKYLPVKEVVKVTGDKICNVSRK